MHELLQKLTVLVGENNVLTGDAVRQRATSWFDNTPMSAAAIVRPGTTAEVTAVIQCCAEHGVALIPMGGLTGFVEGAVAGDQQIGLSLERLTRIESFDVENRSVVVEAGVPLQALQEAAEAHGLHFPVDLGARGSCTIGGMTATNAGGNEVLRRGMMREQILGMEVVLANGEVLTNLRPLIKNNTGYDLKQLFIGSEGSLGVVTRLCLRLRPKHLSHSTALVATDSFDKVAHLLRHLEAPWVDAFLLTKSCGRTTMPLLLTTNKHTKRRCRPTIRFMFWCRPLTTTNWKPIFFSRRWNKP